MRDKEEDGGGSEPSGWPGRKLPDTWELLLAQAHGHAKPRFQVLVNLHLLGRSQTWVWFPTGPARVTLAQMWENLAGKGPKGSTSTLALTPEPGLLIKHHSCKMTITRHWSIMNALGPAGVAQ